MSFEKAEQALSSLLSNMALQAQRERINARLQETKKEETQEQLKLELAVNDLKNLKSTYNSKLESLNTKSQQNENSLLAFNALPNQYKTSTGVELTRDLNEISLESLNEEIKFFKNEINRLDSARVGFLNNLNDINLIKNTLESELDDFDKNFRITGEDIDAAFSSQKLVDLRDEIEAGGFANTDQIFESIQTEYKTDESLAILTEDFLKTNTGYTPSTIQSGIEQAKLKQQEFFDDIFAMSFIPSGTDGSMMQLGSRLVNAMNQFRDELESIKYPEGGDFAGKRMTIKRETGLSEDEFTNAFVEIFGSVTDYSEYAAALEYVESAYNIKTRAYMKRIYENMNPSIESKFKQIEELNLGIEQLNQTLIKMSQAKNVNQNLENNSTNIDSDTFFKD
tara:strand:+ start:1885 stop:3069 length:1185 start_codon:yes stop_codon:yes gene_type:complete